MSNSPVASVISDPRQPDNPIIACNAAFIDLTGYAEHRIIGRNCKFLAGPTAEPWLSETISSAVKRNAPVLFEILNYKCDGTPFRNAVLVAPLFDEDDELDDCFVSVRQTEDEWFVYCQKTWSVLPFSTSNLLLDALIFWLNYCTLSTSVLCSWQKYGA